MRVILKKIPIIAQIMKKNQYILLKPVNIFTMQL